MGFVDQFGPGLYIRSTKRKEGVVLEDSLIVVGTGAVGSSGGKLNRPGVFVEVLSESRRFRGVDCRIRDRVDNI